MSAKIIPFLNPDEITDSAALITHSAPDFDRVTSPLLDRTSNVALLIEHMVEACTEDNDPEFDDYFTIAHWVLHYLKQQTC